MRKLRLLIILCVVGALAYGIYMYAEKHDLSGRISDVVNIDLQFPGDQSGDPMVITSRKDDGTQKKPGSFYKWTDSAGVIHYTNDPSSIHPQYKDKLEQVGAKTVAVGDAVIEETVESQRVITNENSKPEARLFVSENCRECDLTIDLLARMDIKVKILNIDTNPQSLDELKRISAGHWDTPLLLTPEGKIAGYKPNDIKRLFLR